MPDALERRGNGAAERYAAHVDDAVERVRARGGRLAGFIAETFPSVAGQILPSDGYLRRVYERVRPAGGVCIADEVQTGLGRLGEFFWGFEQQGARPDVVVLGKPLGNGHPLGAGGARRVVTALRQLERTGARRALVTLCVGVGQGVALAIET